jgi:hypothetical protein
MATIQDLISQYENKNIANINNKKYRAGLGSPQLSPELLKALKVPENKGLGSFFPAGVPGASGTDYYDNTVKFFGGDPKNPQTNVAKYFGDLAGKPLLSLAEDTVKLGKAFGFDRLKGSPIGDNINELLFGTPETTRQNLGQDILSQIQEENFMSSVPKSDKEIQQKSQIDSLSGAGGGDQVISQDNQLIDTKEQFSDPEADARIAEMQQKITENTQLGDMSQEGAEMEVITPEMREPVLTEEEKKAQAQQTLFTEAMKDFNSIYGDDKTPSRAKTIEDYKADFAKATGIDVSGEPDNKLALMSLGLSLMQNRAGKGFNLSNIIGAAGEAGQKALPLFEAARKEAKAGQVAAGKFALQETKADRISALATAKEKRAALSALGKEFRDQKFKRQLEYIKHKNNMDIKLLENDMKPIDAKGKVTTQTLEGNNFLKVDTAFVTGSRNRVFLAPVQQAEKHANQYVNILEAKGSIRKVQDLLVELGKKDAPTALELLKDKAVSILKPLGIGDTDYSQGIEQIIKEGTTPQQKIEAIQARLISQYKKFLTKETGNGVSEGDIERLKQLIGEIKVGQPIAANISRLKELETIFDAPQRAIESQFNSFSKRENYRNEEEYLKTMDILNKAISTGTDDLYSSSVVDGVFTIDLRKR